MEKLDVKTIVKTAGPVYVPTALSMVLSAGCVIGAVHVDERRNAALAAACTLSESALKTYQDKVLETIGPEKEQEIRETIALEKMAKYPEPATIQPAKNLVTTDISYDQRVKCWESLTNTYFWTTKAMIEKAINGVNKQLLSDFQVSENDLFLTIWVSTTASTVTCWAGIRIRGLALIFSMRLGSMRWDALHDTGIPYSAEVVRRILIFVWREKYIFLYGGNTPTL